MGVGQVVWILATTRDGRLETNRIAVYSAVAGRIEAVDAASRRLRVAGRDVLVPDGSRVQGAGGRRGFASLTRGQNIDVSGLLDAEGAVIASRVVVVSEVPRADIAPTRVGDLIAASSGIERLSIEGYVDRRIRADRILVGGLEIDLSGRPAQVGRIDRGARVLATGYIAPDGSLRVTRQLIRPPVPKRPLETPGDSSLGSEDAGVTPVERATVPTDVESPIRLEQEIPVRVERLDLPDRPTLQRIDRPKPVERIDRPDRIAP